MRSQWRSALLCRWTLWTPPNQWNLTISPITRGQCLSYLPKLTNRGHFETLKQILGTLLAYLPKLATIDSSGVYLLKMANRGGLGISAQFSHHGKLLGLCSKIRHQGVLLGQSANRHVPLPDPTVNFCQSLNKCTYLEVHKGWHNQKVLCMISWEQS